MCRIYVIGSLRNPEVPDVANLLRRELPGVEAFDDWYAGSEDADDWWMEYEKGRGHGYKDALYGHAADHVFDFDFKHIQQSQMGILVQPAGKSGHLELGFIAGSGKPTLIYWPEGKLPDRWEVMARFASRVVFSEEELLKWVRIELALHAGATRRDLYKGETDAADAAG